MTESNGNNNTKQKNGNGNIKDDELDTYFASEKIKIPETETVSLINKHSYSFIFTYISVYNVNNNCFTGWF